MQTQNWEEMTKSEEVMMVSIFSCFQSINEARSQVEARIWEIMGIFEGLRAHMSQSVET